MATTFPGEVRGADRELSAFLVRLRTDGHKLRSGDQDQLEADLRLRPEGWLLVVADVTTYRRHGPESDPFRSHFYRFRFLDACQRQGPMTILHERLGKNDARQFWAIPPGLVESLHS